MIRTLLFWVWVARVRAILPVWLWGVFRPSAPVWRKSYDAGRSPREAIDAISKN